jgi:glycosyltransferase involved in cell wall biosynthesis
MNPGNPKSRLDVLHVTTVHKAHDTRIFSREARTASKSGLRVGILGPASASETIDGVSIIPLRTSSNRHLSAILSPLRALTIILTLRPTIVHFHDPEIIPTAVFLKFLGYKLVWDIHEFYSEVQTAQMPPSAIKSIKRRLISLFIERLPCRFFDRSVFATESLRNAICASNKTISCVNLLPVEEFPTSSPPERKEWDMIFMGSMSPFRAEPFLEVVKIMTQRRPDFRAALLGVPQSTCDWMRKNTPSPATLQALTFLPRVPPNQVANVLSRARIGFNYHPMQRRFLVALPMKVYEYMICGLATVCSKFPELVEQFPNGEICFVDGDDPNHYADSITQLLQDDDLRLSVGRRGMESIKSRINWEGREAGKLLSMYNDLLNKKGFFDFVR